MNKQSISAGFLLYEVSIVIILCSISLLLLYPSTLVSQIQITMYKNKIYQQLQYARAVALVTKNNIITCPSNDRTNCTIDWQSNYIISKQDTKAISIMTKNKNIPINWHADLDNNPVISFQSNGASTKEQGTLDIGCGSNTQCYHIVINYNGNITST